MTDITCEGCYHSKIDGSCGNDKECSLCIRNASLMSSRTLEKEIEIDGVKFKSPMDMYITRDRMKFEDYMRTRKIIEAIESARREKTPYQNPYPGGTIPQPNYPPPLYPEGPIYWCRKEWEKTTSRE